MQRSEIPRLLFFVFIYQVALYRESRADFLDFETLRRGTLVYTFFKFPPTSLRSCF